MNHDFWQHWTVKYELKMSFPLCFISKRDKEIPHKKNCNFDFSELGNPFKQSTLKETIYHRNSKT